MAIFQSLYFDRVYTPVYDYTVGRIAAYRDFQSNSILRLNLKPGVSLLSVGVGTGNEITQLLPIVESQDISVTAVDFSPRALGRVKAKTERARGLVRPVRVDAHALAFRDNVFDRVLCLHTMDFLASPERAASELVRVLRPGGEFVVTFPSGKGGSELGFTVARSVINSVRRGELGQAIGESAAGIGAVFAYLPLALATKPAEPGFFNPAKITQMMVALNVDEFEVAEDPVYQDFLVHGIK